MKKACPPTAPIDPFAWGIFKRWASPTPTHLSNISSKNFPTGPSLLKALLNLLSITLSINSSKKFLKEEMRVEVKSCEGPRLRNAELAGSDASGELSTPFLLENPLDILQTWRFFRFPSIGKSAADGATSRSRSKASFGVGRDWETEGWEERSGGRHCRAPLSLSLSHWIGDVRERGGNAVV